MPVIDIQLVRGIFTPEQKRIMIAKITDTMVEIEGEHVRGLTQVRINEFDSADWGIGGQPFQIPMPHRHARSSR